MVLSQITFQNSGYFSKLMVDYLNQEDNLKSLYNRFPSINNFEAQINEKQQNYSLETREIVQRVLIKQYKEIDSTASTRNNINLLSESNTYTITTGHQLNLFTGPLYFLYKIISTINLTKELKQKHPDCNFVPVYWMATEDHDFEEINHFTYENKVICWNKESKGPVGRLSTEGLDKILDVFQAHLGVGHNALYIKELFEKAYLQHSNLADATRYLANELFGVYGLVILDGDCSDLKKVFVPYVKEELLKQNSISAVEHSFPILKDYFIQVNPRDINLFYILDDMRERIVKINDTYKVNHTDIVFTESAILQELDNHPERFSPNVILRPLYQEILLPNLAYIGGGGELAYWLELKKVFELHQVTFPMLLLRNSVLLVTEKQDQKATRLNINSQNLFTKQDVLIKQKTTELSTNTFDFEQQRVFLKKQFDDLEQIALNTDKSFIGAVKAQEKKQLKGLSNLEKRLQLAEQKKHGNEIERIIHLQNELFPNKNLQERVVNFSEYYREFGKELLLVLFKELHPLHQNFDVLILKNK